MARNYTDKTIKRLFALSGNQCSFLDCTQKLVNENNASNSNICHIEAKNKNGMRYNPNMTEKERDDYPNLILLCPTHHEVIDSDDSYTVEKLKQIKQDHEDSISIKINPNPRTSFLFEVINTISKCEIDEIESTTVRNAFDIEEKITYNNIERYKDVFKEYKSYQGKLNTIYNEMEENDALKKISLLRNIQTIYLQTKSSLFGTNSDDVIDMVKNKLWQLFEDVDTNNNISYEDLNFSLDIIIIDAFMRCKILEEPK